MAQNDKTFCVLCFISQELYIIWLTFIVHMCKMVISPPFFKFFLNFDFMGCWGVKGQDKKLSVALHISGAIIILSFMVHMCKMITSPGAFFHFFKILIFWVMRGSKWKKWSKMTKFSVTLHIRGSIHYMIVIFGMHM